MENIKYSDTSIVLINTGTKEEAEIEHNKFIRGVKKYNFKNTMVILSIIATTLAVLALVNYFLDDTAKFLFMLGAGLVVCITLRICLDSYKSTCDVFSPPVYQYHQILSKYKILHVGSRVIDDEHVLVCDVADENNEVKHKYIHGFKQVVKAGITQSEADLMNCKIHIPYTYHEEDNDA